MLKLALATFGALAALTSMAAAATGQAVGKRHYKPVNTTFIYQATGQATAAGQATGKRHYRVFGGSVYQNVAPRGLMQRPATMAPRHFQGPVIRFSQGRRGRF